ncbi:hypothetical protein B0T19DRAFT_139067 [Cercophora scortea]|uniref:Uncharacterized protein n=1 Tax=Cercophora scortea TaxID=314031 RepID=A0AAE0IZ35_9PEZI|nr:hypothetical protein B0T19DRAFT_139067 [Cercophora scortea]
MHHASAVCSVLCPSCCVPPSWDPKSATRHPPLQAKAGQGRAKQTKAGRWAREASMDRLDRQRWPHHNPRAAPIARTPGLCAPNALRLPSGSLAAYQRPLQKTVRLPRSLAPPPNQQPDSMLVVMVVLTLGGVITVSGSDGCPSFHHDWPCRRFAASRRLKSGPRVSV